MSRSSRRVPRNFAVESHSERLTRQAVERGTAVPELQSSCPTGKVRHETARAAATFAREMMRRRGGAMLHHYFCDKCGAWHLTRPSLRPRRR